MFTLADGNKIQIQKYVQLQLFYEKDDKRQLIVNGHQNVYAGSTFTISCVAAEGYTWTYRLLNGPSTSNSTNATSWKIEKEGDHLSITVPEASKGSQVILLFTAIAADNQAHFFQVVLTVVESVKIENEALAQSLRQALHGQQVVDDEGNVDMTLVEGICDLSMSSTELTSMQGLEIFPNLKSLELSAPISEVDWRVIPHLNKLTLRNTNLTILELPVSSTLKHMECNNNPHLKSILVGGTDPVISSRGQQLDVCTLEFFACLSNDSLTFIDLRKSVELKEIQCMWNGNLTTLLLPDSDRLEHIQCRENKLTSLDLSKSTGLRVVYCFQNQITTLKTGSLKFLKTFWCFNNRLTTLDVSQLPALGNVTDYSFNCAPQMNEKGETIVLSLTVNQTQRERWKKIQGVEFVDSTSKVANSEGYSF